MTDSLGLLAAAHPRACAQQTEGGATTVAVLVSRPTAGRCGCAAARRTCAAFETYHTWTAGAWLASPAELHHVTAAAVGTNSFARGWLWHSDGDTSLQHRCRCGPDGEIRTTLPVSNSRQPS